MFWGCPKFSRSNLCSLLINWIIIGIDCSFVTSRRVMWLSSISHLHWVMWLSAAWCDFCPALVHTLKLIRPLEGRIRINLHCQYRWLIRQECARQPPTPPTSFATLVRLIYEPKYKAEFVVSVGLFLWHRHRDTVLVVSFLCSITQESEIHNNQSRWALVVFHILDVETNKISGQEDSWNDMIVY